MMQPTITGGGELPELQLTSSRSSGNTRRCVFQPETHGGDLACILGRYFVSAGAQAGGITLLRGRMQLCSCIHLANVLKGTEGSGVIIRLLAQRKGKQ